MGRELQDGGGRAALVPVRRGRSRPPPVHARSRTGRRGREGRAQDEVALRRAARAVLARRAAAPPGLGRAAHGHGRLARRCAPADARGSVPALGRARRRRGDAAALRRGGAERARVRGADAVPLGCRRDAGRSRAGAPRSIRSRSRSSSSSSGSPATCRTSRAASSAAGPDGLVGYLPRAGGAVCSPCAPDETVVPLARGLPRHARAHLEPARRRARPRRSASARCATRSRSSSRRTSSTAASACARWRREARPRRRLRARRRPGADRPRGRPSLPDASRTGRRGARARCRTR